MTTFTLSFYVLVSTHTHPYQARKSLYGAVMGVNAQLREGSDLRGAIPPIRAMHQNSCFLPGHCFYHRIRGLKETASQKRCERSQEELIFFSNEAQRSNIEST